MKRLKTGVAVAILLLLIVSVRAISAQNTHTYYLPLVFSEPTLTPTSTATPTPTRTLTPTPSLTPTPAPGYLHYTTSYYMNSVDPAKYFALGCTLGQRDRGLSGPQDSIVVLDLGKASGQNGQYGVILFNVSSFVSTASIVPAFEQFGAGYWACAQEDRQSHVTVGAGTSNNGTFFSTASNSGPHGAAWANMVRQINEWYTANGYAGQVTAVGAIDMELDWNSPIVSRAWTDGFHSADQNRYQYYDFGDCASCPSIYHPSWSPNNGWTLADIWYVAWGAGPAFPLPLIYANDGINAYQWQYLSRYSSVNKGGAILFPGPMTESQACVQQNGCGSLNNTPQQGWTQLFEALNSEPRTAQKYLPWETDIKYYYK